MCCPWKCDWYLEINSCMIKPLSYYIKPCTLPHFMGRDLIGVEKPLVDWRDGPTHPISHLEKAMMYQLAIWPICRMHNSWEYWYLPLSFVSHLPYSVPALLTLQCMSKLFCLLQQHISPGTNDGPAQTGWCMYKGLYFSCGKDRIQFRTCPVYLSLLKVWL